MSPKHFSNDRFGNGRDLPRMTAEDAAGAFYEDDEPTPPTAPEPEVAITVAPVGVLYDSTHDAMWINYLGITPTRLLFDERITRQDWLDFYTVKERFASASDWTNVDYFAIGADVLKMTYQEMGEVHGLKWETVQSYASVARNLSDLIRIKSPTFGHARMVVNLPVEYQDYWLTRAVEGRWSVAKMREEMAAASGRRKTVKAPSRKQAQRQIQSLIKPLVKEDRAAAIEMLEAILNDLKGGRG